MIESCFATARRLLIRLYGLVDSTRKLTVNFLFLLIVAVVVFVLIKSRLPVLESKTALVINFSGQIGEQRKGTFRDLLLEQTQEDESKRVLLRDLLGVLDSAAKDPNIANVVLMLDDFEGAGLPTLREVAGALDRCKAAGKLVFAWSSHYDQRQYYLAAHATQIFMHPMGMVYLQGYGGLRNYYRAALDKLGVSATLIRVGTFKSAAEPFISNGPSAAAREAENYLYQGLWATYLGDVETARQLPSGALMTYINQSAQRLEEAQGDTAKIALSAKLVDAVKTRDELTKFLIERGAKDGNGDDYRQVSFDDYLRKVTPSSSNKSIGVVIAEGEIVDGDAPPGTVGGRSTADLIRQAREDDHINALVLRVNSPGGSVLGSELLRRELELTRAAGKPVIVSMGDVAASGGYWISMASDEVIADPATITGSIGVFALLPSVDKAMGKVGIHADGVSTTWLGNAADPRRPLDPRVKAMLQIEINHLYNNFTERVAQSRKTTPEKIDRVGQGRVWSGAQAKDRGLVDSLGGFNDAIKQAALRAKLPYGYGVVYFETEPGKLASLLDNFSSRAITLLTKQFNIHMAPANLPQWLGRDIQSDFGWLTEMGKPGKPFTVVAHCLCTAP
jgi:protease-4